MLTQSGCLVCTCSVEEMTPETRRKAEREIRKRARRENKRRRRARGLPSDDSEDDDDGGWRSVVC